MNAVTPSANVTDAASPSPIVPGSEAGPGDAMAVASARLAGVEDPTRCSAHILVLPLAVVDRPGRLRDDLAVGDGAQVFAAEKCQDRGLVGELRGVADMIGKAEVGAVVERADPGARAPAVRIGDDCHC